MSQNLARAKWLPDLWRTVALVGNESYAIVNAPVPSSSLTVEEERQLVKRWKEGRDLRARDQLVLAHLRHVALIAGRFRGYRVPLDELVAEGCFGLVLALAKFDPGRGTRFLTYARHWIRCSIVNHVLRSQSLVGSRAGVFRSAIFFKLRREHTRALTLFGQGDDATRLLADRLGVSTDRAASMVARLESRDVSLDANLGAASDHTLLDLLPAGEEDHVAPELDARSMQAIHAAIADLDERERYIIEKRLLADPEDELSLAALARFFGISRERARQLEERAKHKLRRRVTIPR